MKRFLLLTIFAFMLYSVSVHAQSFEIIQDSINLSESAGQTLNSNFNVKNTGAQALNINFSGFTLTKGPDTLTVSSLSNIVNLAAGASQPSSFSVVIPSGQALGLYTGTITANSNLSSSDTIKINVNVTPTFSVSTVSQIYLGTGSLNKTKTASFDITNTGTGNLTKVFFKFSNVNIDFHADKNNFTLVSGLTETVNFNITIPADFSTGNVTLGSVNLDSTELDEKLFDVSVEISGGLIIEDLDVILTTRVKRQSDGLLRSKTESDLDLVDGKSLDFGAEDVGPGSQLRFDFNIENTFPESDNIDIEGVTVTVTIEEIDDGDDIEEESIELDIDSGKSETVDVFLYIPLSVLEGKYDVIIDLEGEDKNENTHTDNMNLEFTVKKEPRDITITTASLFPEKIICSGTSTLTATITNLGNRLEDDVRLQITNPDLGINVIEQNIELDEDPFDADNEFTKQVGINVDRGMKAGTYPIIVDAYLEEGARWESRTANLVVEACSNQLPEEELVEEEVGEQEEEIVEEVIEQVETVESVAIEEEETTEGMRVPVLKPSTTEETPLIKRTGFISTIIILNLLVVIIIGFLIVKLIEKK